MNKDTIKALLELAFEAGRVQGLVDAENNLERQFDTEFACRGYAVSQAYSTPAMIEQQLPKSELWRAGQARNAARLMGILFTVVEHA